MYIGFDIGGTHVRWAVSEEKVLLKGKQQFTYYGDPYQEVECNLCEIVDEITALYPQYQLKGLGISLAAILDRKTKVVQHWPNNSCWNSYRLDDHLKRRLGTYVVYEDDANCGAISEYNLRRKKFNSCAYISLGTGVGCGLVLDKKLYIGDHGFAGELGHIDINTGTVCTCGRKGCLQSTVSGRALEHTLKVMHYSGHDTKTAKQEFIRQMETAVSRQIYNIAMLLDIPIFVLGGGMAAISPTFIGNIHEQANCMIDNFHRSLTVESAAFGEYSGVYGALALVDENFNGETV